jgi:hypothetical protein
MRYRIRKGSFTQNLYLSRAGEWVHWRDAAKFRSQAAAEKFARKHNLTDYGLF